MTSTAPESTEPEVTAPEDGDITDLARALRYAWDIARAAIPFGPEIEDHDGPVRGGHEDPRYLSLMAARQTAFEWSVQQLVGGERKYRAEPWMVGALRSGIIPGAADGSAPGSEAVAPYGAAS